MSHYDCKECHQDPVSGHAPECSRGKAKAMAHDELVKWETFRDEAYYDMWCVRPTGERRFEHGFHLVNGDEAKGLCHLIEQQAAALQAKEDGLKVRDNHIAKLEAALHRISLGSQNSSTTKESLGCEARAALENTDGQ